MLAEPPYTPLPHLGVLRAQGPDAVAFLHGQLTNDLLGLGPEQARLAAYCDAKGRMLASMVVVKSGADELLLVLPIDTLTATCKRLSLFVLRAKVKLSDATADWQVEGAIGPTGAVGATGAPPPWACQRQADALVLQLPPADGAPRALRLRPLADAARAAPDAAALAAWYCAEVRSGVAWVSAPLVGLLVPQMLNYESVQGVSFKKGCYPGQEVVARSQFRGTLKRRAYLARCADPMTVGAELYPEGAACEDAQPCGLVVQATPAAEGGWAAIVAIQISAFESGTVRLGDPTGSVLNLQAPPYPLLADV